MSRTFMKSIVAFHEVIGGIQSGSSVSIYSSTKTGSDSVQVMIPEKKSVHRKNNWKVVVIPPAIPYA